MSAALQSLMPNITRAPVAQPSMRGQMLAFLAIGGVAIGAYSLLSGMAGQVSGADSWLLSGLCGAVLVWPSYLAHRRFSFRSSMSHAQGLPRYVGVQVLALALAMLVSFLIEGVFGLPSALMVAAVVLVMAADFLVLRNWAFTAAPLRSVFALQPVTHE